MPDPPRPTGAASPLGLTPGEYLNLAGPLLERQIHPTTICNGYLKALDDAIKVRPGAPTHPLPRIPTPIPRTAPRTPDPTHTPSHSHRTPRTRPATSARDRLPLQPPLQTRTPTHAKPQKSNRSRARNPCAPNARAPPAWPTARRPVEKRHKGGTANPTHPYASDPILSPSDPILPPAYPILPPSYPLLSASHPTHPPTAPPAHLHTPSLHTCLHTGMHTGMHTPASAAKQRSRPAAV